MYNVIKYIQGIFKEYHMLNFLTGHNLGQFTLNNKLYNLIIPRF